MATLQVTSELAYARTGQLFNLAYLDAPSSDAWSSSVGDHFQAEHGPAGTIADGWAAFVTLRTDPAFDGSMLTWHPTPEPITDDGPTICARWGSAHTGSPPEPSYNGPTISTVSAWVDLKMRLAEDIPSSARNIKAAWEFDLVDGDPSALVRLVARRYLPTDLIDDPVVGSPPQPTFLSGVLADGVRTYTLNQSFAKYTDMAEVGWAPGTLDAHNRDWALALWATDSISGADHFPPPNTYDTGALEPGRLKAVRLTVTFEVDTTPPPMWRDPYGLKHAPRQRTLAWG